MAATTQEELIALTNKEYAKLKKLIQGMDEALAIRLGPDGISIKDTLAHRAHWIDLFFGWVDDGRAGKTVQTPAPGYKWNRLKDYNAKLREATRTQSWEEVKAGLQKAHDRLLKFLEDEDQASLYTAHLYPWMNNWTIGRWAEASGPSHFRSAAKFIRQILRDFG